MNDYEIEQGALRLREIDTELVETILRLDIDGAKRLADEFRKLKREIQVAQIDTSQLRISSSEALDVLRQLRAGIPFHTDKLFSLRTESGDKLPLDELTEAEVEEVGSDVFHSWFSHYDYVQSLYRLGTLLVTADVPDRVLVYLREARQCYAFQQYHAVLALCRAFIEATARDICEQLQLIGDNDEAVVRRGERIFSRLVGPIAKGELRRRINHLYYGLASPVVHGARSVSAAEARQAIKDTLLLAEDLYHEHGLSGAA